MEREGKFGTVRLKPGKISDLNSYKVRKGKVGSYKEELSKSDVEYINQRISAKLRIKAYR